MSESPPGPPDLLVIRISAGQGVGPTRLAAFDHALQSAGVADFNLVRLSSVIPPDAEVTTVPGTDQIVGDPGDRLYCVYAESYASSPGDQAWAGLAWTERADRGTGGLFVEDAGSSEHSVEHGLRATLESMIAHREGAYRPIERLLSSVICVDHPVCAVVIATYRRSGWSST